MTKYTQKQLKVYLICQRYKFKSKSQPRGVPIPKRFRCIWYVKGTNLKANHNGKGASLNTQEGVFDISKVQI